MRVGFYAPLKSPNHDVPSGDRAMARLFISALRNSGHDVDLVSQLRSWDGTGSSEYQQHIHRQAKTEVSRLKQFYSKNPPPDLVFTYHVYHKAPDWIGIELAEHLSVPYVIAEASYAPKQAGGAWDMGHQQTLSCINASKTIICLNPNDIECIQPIVSESQNLKLLKPFLGCSSKILTDVKPLKAAIAKEHNLDQNKVWLITVAMMRHGDKYYSYQQLSKTISELTSINWELIIIGDGQAANTIKRLFSSTSDQCLFLGKLNREAIVNWLLISDVFIWPAINEAFGLALLEAQACGLPVVAQDFGGVSNIVMHSKTGYVTNPKIKNTFTHAVMSLIENKELRTTMAQAARKNFVEQHSFKSACEQINKIIKQAVTD